MRHLLMVHISIDQSGKTLLYSSLLTGVGGLHKDERIVFLLYAALLECMYQVGDRHYVLYNSLLMGMGDQTACLVQISAHRSR